MTDVGLVVLDLGADAPVVSRAEIAQAAWHEDHPAVLVTLAGALAGRDIPWEVEDHRGLRRMAHGSLPTLHGAQLSSDGCSVGARGRGEVVRLHTITSDGPGVPVERLAGGVLASVIALRGDRLVTLAQPTGAPSRLRVSDGRGTFEAAPFVGMVRIEDARISPDGARLAVIVDGRAAVLALPGA